MELTVIQHQANWCKLQHDENGLEENTLAVWRNEMNTI